MYGDCKFQLGAFGLFALKEDTSATRITEEAEQTVYTEEYTMRVDEMVAVNMHIALDAENMLIALDADNMPTGLDDATMAETDNEIKGVMEVLVHKNCRNS